MTLKPDLLFSDEHQFHESPLNGTSIMGIYNPMQFVLRLRKDIHENLETITPGIHSSGTINENQVQAFSTYLHETIHWWQHVGSNYGFITSLIFPVQTHVVKRDLDELVSQGLLVKSIKKYYESSISTDSHIENPSINRIINNWYDLYFAGLIGYDPELTKEIVKNKYFESVGHSLHILWSSAIQTLASSLDKDFEFLPDIKKWSQEFGKLNEQKEEGFYFGSRVVIPPFGTKAILEGQARFSQLQYLHFAFNKAIDIKDFESSGMFHGIYGESFKFFIETLGEDFPESIDDPLVGLFLLICDLSINNVEGFPLDIYHFESFILTIDPGIRFTTLCFIVRDKHPDLKQYVKSYSRDEYIHVSEVLSKDIASLPPLLGSELIATWAEHEPSIVELMEEESKFVYKDENLPVRLFFSKYIRFQMDKFNYPQFSCWPGTCFTSHKPNGLELEVAQTLFDRHRALFMDGIDGDIYPSIFENVEEKNIMDSFNAFYQWNSTYQMVRQWIIQEGEFKIDFNWLTSKFPQVETEKWTEENFKQVFGISYKDLDII